MPIEDRDLKAGTRLVARHKGQERSCEVVQADEGLRFRLDDGTEYKSPSSAGKAVTGGVAVNGWKFWSLDGDLKPAKERKPKAERAAKKSKDAVKPKAKKAKSKGAKKAKRPKAQRAASDASYGCGVCGESFGTMKAAAQHAQEAHLN